MLGPESAEGGEEEATAHLAVHTAWSSVGWSSGRSIACDGGARCMAGTRLSVVGGWPQEHLKNDEGKESNSIEP